MGSKDSRAGLTVRSLLTVGFLVALQVGAFQVHVQTSGRGTLTLEVVGADTVASLKSALVVPAGIPAAEQYLTLGSVPLEDGLTLADYGLGEGATLQLRVRYILTSAVDAILGGASTGGLYALSDSAGQGSIGEAGSADYGTLDGFWPTVQSAPRVPERSLGVEFGQDGSFLISKLISRATDEDDDSFSIRLIAGPSEQGGVVRLENGAILYSAPPGFQGQDSFGYTVVDSGGDTFEGTVWVTVHSPAGNRANILSVAHNAGPPPTFTLRFAGLPGGRYRVQASGDLASWDFVEGDELVVPTAGAGVGIGTFVETNPPGGARYYRTVFVNPP